MGGAWRVWGADAGGRGRRLWSICWLTKPPSAAWQSVPRRGHCRASEPPGPLCPLGLGERMQAPGVLASSYLTALGMWPLCPVCRVPAETGEWDLRVPTISYFRCQSRGTGHPDEEKQP